EASLPVQPDRERRPAPACVPARQTRRTSLMSAKKDNESRSAPIAVRAALPAPEAAEADLTEKTEEPGEHEVYDPHVHGANLAQKEAHRTKYRDQDSKRYLEEIRAKYDDWKRANFDLKGPGLRKSSKEREIVTKRVELFTTYKDFIDQQRYAE